MRSAIVVAFPTKAVLMNATPTALTDATQAERPLDNKVVLVTGGAKNLGGHVSRDLAIQGARVAVHYNSDAAAAAAEETVGVVTDAGTDAFAIQADLSDVAQVERTFDAVVDRFGSLYATVNTAGMAVGRPVVEFEEAEYDAMMAVNAKAAFFVMREAAKRTEDGGRILTLLTSLLAAFTPIYSVYAGSKAPVEHFTRALSKELQDRSISVNALAPGPMDTSFFWDAVQPGEADFVQSQAMRNQLTQVDDIVPWVRFLLTDGWWLNGQTVFVNGGFTTR
jgi:NAD(P)-dependent dehydrogenase (short-subunit alcohol dehydrogenase family)